MDLQIMKYFLCFLVLVVCFIPESIAVPEEKTELYRNRRPELIEHFIANLKWINGYLLKPTNKHHEAKCKWHYIRIKNNSNVDCELSKEYPFLSKGQAFVRIGTKDGYQDNMLQGSQPICDCWKKDEERIIEKMFVADLVTMYQEFVFNVINISEEPLAYTFGLQSCWHKL